MCVTISLFSKAEAVVSARPGRRRIVGTVPATTPPEQDIHQKTIWSSPMNVFKSTLIAAALVAAGVAGNADAATANSNFQVKINITESCSFSSTGASDVDFGNKARMSTGNVDTTGILVVNCTQGTTY